MSYQFTAGRFKAFTSAGDPASGYKLYTYVSGTTTNKATYTDATLATPNANPVVLDAVGEAQVWLTSGAYTFVLKTSGDVPVWTVDGVVDPSYTGQQYTDDLRADLLDPAQGSGLSGHDPTVAYADGTVGSSLKNLTYAEDYTTLQAAFTAAKANNAPLVLAKKTYTVTTPLTDCEVTIYGNGATIDMSGMGTSDKGLTAQGTISTTLTIAANITAGATTFTVSSSTGVVAGDWAYLRSSDVWSTSDAVTVGEFVRIFSVVGTTITTYSPIRYSYTTANSAALDVLVMAGGFSWNDFTILGSGSGSQQGLMLWRCMGVNLNNVSTRLVNNVGVLINRCYGVVINGGTYERANLAGNSYGVEIYNGSSNVTVSGVSGIDLRHTVTIGGSSGVCCGISVVDSKALAARDAGFDCHAACDGVTFRGLFVEGTSTGVDGIVMQGVNYTINDIDLRNIQRYGVFAQMLANTSGTGTITDVQGNAAQILVYAQAYEGSITALTISDIKGFGTNYLIYIAPQSAGKTISNVIIDGVRSTATLSRGINIQANGGTISDVFMTNVKMTTTLEGIYLNASSGTISNVRIASTKLTGGNYSIRCLGSPSGIVVEDASDMTGASVKTIDWATASSSKLLRQVGTATLAAGTVTVTLPVDMPSTSFRLSLSSGANETMRWGSKATTGFSITSSNAASTTAVDYIAMM